ncbi:MAG: TonB-dependent receptor [Candidatus Cyclobacteriaceae bacterium M2_1C_046]
MSGVIYRLVLLKAYLLLAFNCQSQIVLSGQVYDTEGTPLIGATVLVKELQTGVATDVDGKFRIDLQPGSYHITFNYIGFESYSKEVVLNEKDEVLNISLAESTNMLSDVVVRGKSQVTEIKEMPYSVSAIDVKPLKIRNLDVNQILNTTTGVRIREDGGLGSNFNFSLNGFSGNQIKFFIDGIPMDYFGSSLTLNNIPANLISTIEVYKGVVPVHLGSDALGGAVNITTNTAIKNYLNVSYSIGSFNTHRSSLISRFSNKNGFVVNVNAFFNYSDNNYSILAPVPDPNFSPVSGKMMITEVERFHDTYRSSTVQVEAGVENKKYADKLIVGLIASGNYKEVQQSYNLTRPIGEAYTTDNAIIPTLKYQKEDLFIKGLSLTANTTYKYGESARIDTSSRVYNWYGEFSADHLEANRGEYNWYKTRFHFTDNAFMASSNLVYEVNQNQSLSFNNTYHYYTRVGNDPIGVDAIPFTEPQSLEKNISGLSYNLSLLDNKLRSVFFGKYFTMNSATREQDDFAEDEFREISHKHEAGGYGVATTYFLLPNLQIKASFENTNRLPEPVELFGDGLLHLSSPNLGPEQSKNFNLGVASNFQIKESHKLKIEASYLHRKVDNLIRPFLSGNNVISQNLQAAQFNVFEGALQYTFKDLINIALNGTYQSQINNTRYTQTGGINYLYGIQLPNQPFLFGNALLGVMLKDVGHESSALSLNWSTLFVEGFYLKWSNQGSIDKKNDIPRQVSHNISASYAMQNGKYNVSVDCTNLFDSELYDNFRLQKPGRAFHVKLSYFLNK